MKTLPDCAVREVFEETGYDISPLLPQIITSMPTQLQPLTLKFIQSTIHLIIHHSRCPESTSFIPKPGKKSVKFNGIQSTHFQTKYGQDNSFYNVVNFIKKLKYWIKTCDQEYKKNQQQKSKKTKNQRIQVNSQILLPHQNQSNTNHK